MKEMAARQHAFAKETLERKFKNRKIEYDEGTMMRLIKRLGFKIVTDFYQAIADEELDVNEIIDKYQEQQRREMIRATILSTAVLKAITFNKAYRKR